MRFTFMGTGTSHGIPVIACNCQVCTNSEPKDKRLRASAFITANDSDGTPFGIVIDTGPEFRTQALKFKIKSLKAVFLTHSHADHLNGLDDLRIFSHTKYSKNCKNPNDPAKDYPETHGKGLPIYANSNTIKDAKTRFDYIFKKTQIGGGKPKLCFINSKKFHGKTNFPFSKANFLQIGELSILPIPIMHGKISVSGWLFSCTGSDGKKHSLAYLTDCNFISEKSINLIKENAGILDHLVIDALRERKHSTHCNFLQAIAYSEQLAPKNTYFTHICHDKSHAQIEKYVAENLAKFPKLEKSVKNGGYVGPAWDGLTLEV